MNELNISQPKLFLRKIITMIGIFVLVSSCQEKKELEKEAITYENEAKKPADFGRELFEGKGMCASCHQPNQKVVGPSISDIANIYKTNNGDIVSFLRGKEDPIVDPSQYEVMKTNFSITKAMSEEELKGIEAYIYSYSK